MSRNFELLTQIELESRRADSLTRTLEAFPIVKSIPHGAIDEASGGEMLRLVQNVFLMNQEEAPRQVVFCSIDGEDGSSSVCASAGRVLAANGSQSVCLVDANLRSPRLSRMLGMHKPTPFSVTQPSLRGQCSEIESNLWLAGSKVIAGDNGALLPMNALKTRISELRDLFEYVLIAAPGVNVSGDAQLLGQVSDAVILVVEANKTRRLSARKAKESLDAAGVRLLGSVLHDRTFPIPEHLFRRL
jgi:Mrp family chromosome partitioning ATPase